MPKHNFNNGDIVKLFNYTFLNSYITIAQTQSTVGKNTLASWIDLNCCKIEKIVKIIYSHYNS